MISEAVLHEFERHFQHLQSLESQYYPKVCNNCHRVYETPESFLLETCALHRNGIKSCEEEDGSVVIEVFRNCCCGSTLLGNFSNRRDMTDDGVERRKIFAELLGFLELQGVEKEKARQELRNLFSGKRVSLPQLLRQ